jgi:hypothetical protein
MRQATMALVIQGVLSFNESVFAEKLVSGATVSGTNVEVVGQDASQAEAKIVDFCGHAFSPT